VYRFLFRPKWLLFLAGCVALAIVFVELGLWQLDRLDARHSQNDRVTAARQAEPAAVADTLSTGRAPAKRDLFRQVRAVGRYDTDHEYLVRSRTVDDRAGLFVLTPLVTVDGPALLVVRGFVASSSKGAGVAPEIPPAPDGEVTVVGRVRAPESGGTQETRIGAYRAVKRINTARLAGDLDRPTYRGYVELVDAPDGLVAIPEPPVVEGPHLAYAVQWFLFAGLLFVGYWIYARREEQRRRHPELDRPAVEPVNTASQETVPQSGQPALGPDHVRQLTDGI
jgi:cytochrome oxidase assembly protein ShyY1